jgi:rhodanese-related sulfurtransferase
MKAIVLIAIILLIFGWDVVWWVLGVKPRFPWQLQNRLGATGSPPVLLDVRTPLEYNWFHLTGAQNVPDLLADSANLPPLPPSQEVVVICMTGHRSPIAAYNLKKRGFTQVFHLAWGMVGWKIYEWWSQLRRRREPQTPED